MAGNVPQKRQIQRHIITMGGHQMEALNEKKMQSLQMELLLEMIWEVLNSAQKELEEHQGVTA